MSNSTAAAVTRHLPADTARELERRGFPPETARELATRFYRNADRRTWSREIVREAVARGISYRLIVRKIGDAARVAWVDTVREAAIEAYGGKR